MISQEEKSFFIDYKEGRLSQEDLYNRYYRLIRFFVSKGLHNYHDAEDCIQECCIELFKLADEFDIERGFTFSTFLLSQLRAIRTNYQRRLKKELKRKVSIEDSDFDQPITDELSDFSDRFKSAIRSLSEVEKNIIYLHYFKEMTQNEIAKTLGFNRRAIQSYEYRALEKIRTSLLHEEMITDILKDI